MTFGLANRRGMLLIQVSGTQH